MDEFKIGPSEFAMIIPTIITEKEKERWYAILDSTDDIQEVKKVLKELIEALRKTVIKY